ncbi:MAG: BolA family transcriptional regulator [Rhizobiales bacterium NRL2]|jgi:BolA protein|nr:MAG: BolA family transcriptional regulator [Rhizobiales bacterium NRL2]
MTYRERIESKLNAAFSPAELTIRDDSEKHRGHAGYRPEGETHFHVRIVAAAFDGQNRVARQRAVYRALKAELDERVHALSLETLTPAEAA